MYLGKCNFNPKSFLRLYCSWSMVLFTACSPSAKMTKSAAPKINPEQAFLIVKECTALGPRSSGSPGATANVQLICRYLQQSGVTFTLDKWQEKTPAGTVEFCNVQVEISGNSKDKFILIGCHYDTKKMASVPNFAGANDGASGVAVVLAMIDAIAKSKAIPPVNLRFVFFDGEECFIDFTDNDGLYGSRHLAGQMAKNGEVKKCLAVIILDMVGDKDLNITIPSGSDKKLTAKLLAITKDQNAGSKFSRYYQDIIDDHTPFQKLGIPAIDIIDFEFGPGNRYWHTKADTVDKIRPESLQTVGDVALQFIWEISGLGQ